jgi:hypothetical protein
MVPEPWDSFLSALDSELTEEVRLYCVGGFAVVYKYELARETSDIDVLEIAPLPHRESVLAAAGQGERLNKAHGVYVQIVSGMVTVPENAIERATELFPSSFMSLRLFVLDPYDLALSKLERNNQKDRDDVKHLFKTVPLDFDTLEQRYREEQRPFLTNEPRHDLTLALWKDMFLEI